jgi:hypothetical protein
MKGLRM